ncbi:TPA: hypothetical protein DEO28_03580 [Candidatus Dependentiae bacterium]|nr:MAG: hypothetical protein UR14_C0007G0017 [candidate division TM6 bacterium GW2011_GWE2_31_21]KKP53622.1 MAG: hypothetical protein UR43_C0004G0163 [candidate division TM6 bacterium GW2011_GWF2_33_332]HBS48138.1 hypothetical protein [Candidatus Dependentiae bacterium]HBZ73562.1 hypothetical protein [Candidatus Dependentiae bacterium]
MSSFKVVDFAKLSFVFVCLFLSSCVKYYDVSKDEFPQGEKKAIDRDIVAENLKSQSVYDQFSTEAKFSILYMSDDMRELYTENYCWQNGKDENFKVAMMRRQFEENRVWKSFYIHAKIYDEDNRSLADKDSLWTFYLETEDGQRIAPVDRIEVDPIPSEIMSFFGDIYSSFRRTYLFKFPAKDTTGKLYVAEGAKFKMVISSPDKQCAIEWQDKIDKKLFSEKKKTKKTKSLGAYEDIYWM